MKRIDINADRKQTSDCTRVARGKKCSAAQRMQRKNAREKEKKERGRKRERDEYTARRASVRLFFRCRTAHRNIGT